MMLVKEYFFHNLKNTAEFQVQLAFTLEDSLSLIAI